MTEADPEVRAGLRSMAKQFGEFFIINADGQRVRWVWDYANDEPVRESDMPKDSARWKMSERARFGR